MAKDRLTILIQETTKLAKTVLALKEELEECKKRILELEKKNGNDWEDWDNDLGDYPY